ncbi:MAG: Crp/Fnr family transcriptional regulator [Lentimicrobium sp.]
MRTVRHEGCAACHLKCDIYLTAIEMQLEPELAPLHILYKKHETICRQKTQITHAIVMLEGSAKMYIDGLNNKNIILNILLPSNYIGLLPVYGIPESAYNVASISDCHTCHIDIGLIMTMYYSNQNFMHRLNQAFGGSVSAIMRKLISLNQKQIRGKVAESLLYLSQLYDSTRFIMTITRKELAELSAISEENAVRVLTEFKNEGIIDMTGKEITLKELGLLETISAMG